VQGFKVEGFYDLDECRKIGAAECMSSKQRGAEICEGEGERGADALVLNIDCILAPFCSSTVCKVIPQRRDIYIYIYVCRVGQNQIYTPYMTV
jgi:hypothetical protein